MRIAQITPVYPPYRGGMGSVAKRYVQFLRENEHKVDVYFAAQDAILKIGNAGITPKLLTKLKSADVIHLHYPFFGAAVFTAIAAKLYKKPFVVSYHMIASAPGLKGSVFKLYRRLIEPFVLAAADMVIVASMDYAMNHMIKHRNMRELPFSVDEERYVPDYHPLGERLRFLFIGGLDTAHAFKGVPNMLRAFSRIKEREDWELGIIGSGNQQKQFETLAEELGMVNKVSFLGNVDDVAEHVPFYDVHLLPSLNEAEAFGLVTLEAASSGLMSIVSDLPGVRTLVEPQKTGLVVQPGREASLEDALIWCLNHRAEVDDMRKRARDRILSKYTRKKEAAELHRLIGMLR
jgi:rhamnosyl/mannosyltransferase